MSIKTAVDTLKKGGVIAFPTDTVYGIGADPFQSAAIQKLYTIKGRPKNKPIPILVGCYQDVENIAQNLPEIFFQLATQFWPGALTLIVEAKGLPTPITAGGNTVGLRMPDHPIALKILQRFGPIATTSANKSDKAPATSKSEIEGELGNLVDLIIDGGTTNTGTSSTVIDLIKTPPKVLRQGEIHIEIETSQL